MFSSKISYQIMKLTSTRVKRSAIFTLLVLLFKSGPSNFIDMLLLCVIISIIVIINFIILSFLLIAEKESTIATIIYLQHLHTINTTHH